MFFAYVMLFSCFIYKFSLSLSTKSRTDVVFPPLLDELLACHRDGSLDTPRKFRYLSREVIKMPRMPRVISGSGYYHVVSRGIGKQLLFEETEDYECYLNTLQRFLSENSIQLIAYCLMENHVHLLLHAENDLDRAMKQIAVSYSYYFNSKYERTGHLFQDRFMSEPIEDERYLLAVVRYIHNNPPKAGISRREDYRWSSWNEYVGTAGMVSTDVVLHLAGGVERFRQFSESDSQEQYLDVIEKRKLSDSQAIELIRNELHLQSGTQLQTMPRADRDNALRMLKQSGLSVRQIERLTGINRGIIQRA